MAVEDIRLKDENGNFNSLFPIPIDRGGTGQTSVAAARNAFGLGNTSGALPIANGGTGVTTAADARRSISFIGTSPITSTSNDTVANWSALGPGVAWYATTGQLTDQPSQYGILLNMPIGSGAGDIRQMWFSQRDGTIYTRGGNGSGWASWRKVFSTADTIPVANGGTGITNLADSVVACGTSGMWYYLKFNSGIAIIAGRNTTSSVTLTVDKNAWMTTHSFPFTFTTNAVVAYGGGNSSAYCYPNPTNTSSVRAAYRALYASSETFTNQFIIMGKWK